MKQRLLSVACIPPQRKQFVLQMSYVMPCFVKRNNNESLPPTSDSPHLHIERCNYQAHIWRNALVATQNLPSPVGHGWKSNDDQLYSMLVTKGPALTSLMELTSCRCNKSQSRVNCSCKNAGLACTEACFCRGDDECQNPNGVTVLTSDLEESDSE